VTIPEQIKFLDPVDGTLQFTHRIRPEPPVGLESSSGSMEAIVTWFAPTDMRGVDRYRIYQGTEFTLIGETENNTIRQFKVKLPANATDVVYVASISKLGRESIKTPIAVASNSDQYVESGTAGQTAGTASTPSYDWITSPYAGGYGGNWSSYPWL